MLLKIYFLKEASLLIVDSLFVYFDGTHWNYRVLFLVTIFSVAGLVVNAYFITQTEQPEPSSKDFLNHFVKFEFWSFLIFGIVAYSFPDLLCFGLSNPNEGHRSLARTVAANVLSNSFQVYYVSDYKFNNDKRSYFLSRFIVNQIELAFMIFCFLTSPLSKMFLIVNIPYSLWLFYGYLIVPSDQEVSKTD